MVTSLAWLQSYEHGTLALSLAIDGYNLVYTTAQSSDAMVTAYAATSWTTVKSGLGIVGSMTQRITPWSPKVDVDSLTFKILDHDETLLATVLCEAKGRAGAPYLTETALPGAGSVIVNSTSGFTSGTDIYIGQECATQNVTNATTFALPTRGKFAVYGTDIDSDNYARRHICEDDATANLSNSPRVLTAPRTWYNRLVALRVHHWEDAQWSTAANSHLAWVGRIKSWKDTGDGWISITCASVTEALQGDLFPEQWQAELLEGRYIGDVWRAVQGDGYFAASGQSTNDGTLTSNGAVYTWDQIEQDIATVMDGWATAAIRWQCSRISVNGAQRIQFKATSLTATLNSTCTASIRLHPDVWLLLGFLADLTQYDAERNAAPLDANGRRISERRMNRVGDSFYLTAPWAPVRIVTPALGQDCTVQNARGTWVNQPTPVYGGIAGATGFVKIGNGLYWASQSAGTLSLIAGWVEAIENAQPDPFARPALVREDEFNGALEVRQTWLVEGGAGTTLLRLLLSTGTAGYSHTTYDVYGAGIGLGLPSAMLDITSFRALDAAIPAYRFFFEKPTPASKIIETLCAVAGMHPVFKNGKVTLRRLGVEAANIASNHALTEANKARTDDRTAVEYGSDGVLNRISLKYDARPLTNSLRKTETIVIAFSVSDYGPSAATVEAPGLMEPAAWYQSGATALANLAYPMATFTRSYNASLVDIVPGDIVEVTDNFMPHPSTGTRGVTELPAVLLEAGFDWATGIGHLTAGYTPALGWSATRLWGPSARVDETATNSGYNAATYTLTCKAHEFSGATDAADATYFTVGEHVRIVELDPSTAGSPDTWVAVVASQTGNAITLASGLSVPSWNTAKRYMVELDDSQTVSDATALVYAFVADDATNSTGNAANDYSHWWEAQAAAASTISYTTEHARPVAIADDTGEPHSVGWYHYAVNSLNAYLANKSAQNHVTEYLAVAGSNADSTTASLVYGPVCVPIYGHDSRALTVGLQVHSTGAATARVYSAAAPPTGSAINALANPLTGVASVVFAYNAASPGVWQTPQSMVPMCSPGRPRKTWLWVTLQPTAVATTATLTAIDIAEVPLS